MIGSMEQHLGEGVSDREMLIHIISNGGECDAIECRLCPLQKYRGRMGSCKAVAEYNDKVPIRKRLHLDYHIISKRIATEMFLELFGGTEIFEILL